MPDADALIEVAGIDVAIGGNRILSAIDLTVGRGEIVSLIGPNGAGKSTLVRVVLGLLQPDRGKVWRRAGIAIGYVPQRLTIDPILPMTVRRFLALAGRRSAVYERQVLDEVGVPDILDRPVQQVSGGEFQRVLLARALLRQPDLLVLDEPVQGVDLTGQSEIYRLIGRIRDNRGCGVLLVSHDLHLVMAATDRVLCINHHVCCAGLPEAVTQHPEYVALFGRGVAENLALYAHHHDHAHDPGGHVVPLPAAAAAGSGDHREHPDHPHRHDHAGR